MYEDIEKRAYEYFTEIVIFGNQKREPGKFKIYVYKDDDHREDSAERGQRYNITSDLKEFFLEKENKSLILNHHRVMERSTFIKNLSKAKVKEGKVFNSDSVNELLRLYGYATLNYHDIDEIVYIYNFDNPNNKFEDKAFIEKLKNSKVIHHDTDSTTTHFQKDYAKIKNKKIDTLKKWLEESSSEFVSTRLKMKKFIKEDLCLDKEKIVEFIRYYSEIGINGDGKEEIQTDYICSHQVKENYTLRESTLYRRLYETIIKRQEMSRALLVLFLLWAFDNPPSVKFANDESGENRVHFINTQLKEHRFLMLDKDNIYFDSFIIEVLSYHEKNPDSKVNNIIKTYCKVAKKSGEINNESSFRLPINHNILELRSDEVYKRKKKDAENSDK